MASGDWQSAIPFPLSGITVTRDGKTSTLAAIQTNDVIYWNQTMRALWVSSDRVVGVIQELTPSASSPESVKIAGRTYPIESASAAYALSDLGQYGVGIPSPFCWAAPAEWLPWPSPAPPRPSAAA